MVGYFYSSYALIACHLNYITTQPHPAVFADNSFLKYMAALVSRNGRDSTPRVVKPFAKKRLPYPGMKLLWNRLRVTVEG